VTSPIRQPYLGHLVIVGVLLASLGVVRTIYVDPRDREVKRLRSERAQLEADLADLQHGIQDMDAWQRSHPGEDGSRFRARRALPAGAMVAAFLRDLAPVAERWNVHTELIQPAGALEDVVTTDASGRTGTYQKALLRFRLDAGYRDLGEYLREVEAMDQLVVVRSVAIRADAPRGAELSADLTIWLYGTP